MKTFKQTSDKPYDRHQYKIKFDDGKSILFPDYETMQHFWFTNIASWGNKRNAHNFPLDLASAESTTVALTAPSIG